MIRRQDSRSSVALGKDDTPWFTKIKWTYLDLMLVYYKEKCRIFDNGLGLNGALLPTPCWGWNPRGSCILGKCSATKLHLSSLLQFWWYFLLLLGMVLKVCLLYLNSCHITTSVSSSPVFTDYKSWVLFLSLFSLAIAFRDYHQSWCSILDSNNASWIKWFHFIRL